MRRPQSRREPACLPPGKEIRSAGKVVGHSYEYPNDHPFGQDQFRVAVECVECKKWFEAWDNTPGEARRKAQAGMPSTGDCKACCAIHERGLNLAFLKPGAP